jgi:inward rectifier potassium channel
MSHPKPSRVKLPRRRLRAQKTSFGATITAKNAAEISRLSDMYHWLLTTDRINFAVSILSAYFGMNAIFALAYMLVGGIENVQPWNFADNFFFSVQTMATIGYGRMVPISNAANTLVTIEAGLGLFGMAVSASLLFARFTRATAGVRFSKNAVITMFDGKPTFMFRIANKREARINEAQIYMVVAQQRHTAEGYDYRRLFDLKPVRSFSPVFELSWMVMHVIDEDSPFYGVTPLDMEETLLAVSVVFSGNHEGFQQRVVARYAYTQDMIEWDRRFADLIIRDPEGNVVMDYAKFDTLLPVAGKDQVLG